MGKGPKPTEKNVKKQLDYTSSGGSKGGSGKPIKQGDKCIFSFAFDVTVYNNQASGISPSNDVVLALSSSGIAVDIFVAGSSIGTYVGSKTTAVISCMKQNYIYEGVVTKVKHGSNTTVVSCDITGHTK